MFTEFDIVKLIHAFPEHNLVEGDTGVIVSLWGDDGYEVEFVEPDGKTKAIVTLSANDIRPS